MAALTLPDVRDSALRLASEGFVAFPACLTVADAQALELSTRSLPEERVTCGRPGVTWLEAGLPLDHPLSRLFVQPELLSHFASALGVTGWTASPECWTSRYGSGHYIEEHRDAQGSVQFAVCLAAPPADCGGAVVFGAGSSLGRVRLELGDGLLFVASRVVHGTEPLRATLKEPSPQLFVAVARYFELSGERHIP